MEKRGEGGKNYFRNRKGNNKFLLHTHKKTENFKFSSLQRGEGVKIEKGAMFHVFTKFPRIPEFMLTRNPEIRAQEKGNGLY